MPVQPHVPGQLCAWLAPFRSCLTRPTFRHALVLVTGALLTPGRRTITAMLTVVGLAHTRAFTNYHRVLNRNQWSSREVAHCLLALLVAAFLPAGPVVIGLDDTLERRWGARIKARGIYRDPVRSSHGHFVKASGLRWLSVMVLAPIPWASRVWALPFLTVLAPSERFSREHRQRHKALTDWARQALLQVARWLPGRRIVALLQVARWLPGRRIVALLQVARWLPGRRIVAVADQSYAAIELLRAVRHHVCVITRLRLDARLFEPPAPRRRGTIGRPRILGERLPTLAQRLADPKTPWQRLQVGGWYGGGERLVEIISGTAIWHHPGKHVPIRYVLVRDVGGAFKPQAFLCTDLQADPLDILRWFVRRWTTEVTFAEVRRHLGVETQRQWSDKAIARTTPALLGLFSLVTLWTNDPAVR
jgi:DDE superfamily endonuclease